MIDKFAGLPLWKYSMAFAYLKSYLSQYPEYGRASFETRDFYQNESTDVILRSAAAANPAVIFFSAYVWNFLLYAELARAIRSLDRDVVIVMGGPEVAEDGEEILRRNPALDIIVSGEGEHAFREVVRSRLGASSLARVPGISHRTREGVIATTPPDPAVLLDVSRIPSIFTPEFLDLSRLRGSLAAVETQRGCDYSCGFCRYRKIGRGARFFRLERVFAELEVLKNAGIAHPYIMDPMFNSDRERAKRILERIIELDMKVEINAEMVPELLDSELLDLALRGGMKNLERG